MTNIVTEIKQQKPEAMFRLGDIVQYIGPGPRKGSLWIIVGPVSAGIGPQPTKNAHKMRPEWRMASLTDGVFWSTDSFLGIDPMPPEWRPVAGALVESNTGGG